MGLNRTFEWEVMTIWTSWELSLFIFEYLDILCPWIGHPSENLWPFDLLESFRCSISSVSIYYVPESDMRVINYGRLNLMRAFVFNVECLDILCVVIKHPSEKLWSLEFLESFHCSISSVFIYCRPQSYTRVKSYGSLNLAGAFVFNFKRLDTLLNLNRTSES